ncbi:alpha/beta fold hydrolase [Brevundimonas goettingensis]|uniref:Alpha/beta hydrolase n=1 Tax=Brevundimonas goettingensis TaxID=2774190 RepID=A0A975BZX7_9CAUL|nr:alpha/beta hydrolase [Brevundimonas goettingensis]QTC90269.1 alpha/beta hydrolase [Brevundimonas goettingensis]
MPLVPVLKTVFGLISLLVLALAGWLIWSWWGGRLAPAGDGRGLIFVRDDWRLWTGLGLLTWSFLGRLPATLFLARGDTDPSRPRREAGVRVAGSDAELWVETRGGGGGLPIILTHGWGLDSTIWDYASRDLGEDHRLVLWDLPGLGRSKVGPSGVTLPAFAEDLRAVIDHVGETRVILVGHSIGGMTIQTLVRDAPDFVRKRVAGIVLINTTYTNPLRTMIFSKALTALRKPVLEPVFHLMTWLQALFWLGAWQSYLSGAAHIANRFGFGRFVTRSQLEHTTLLTTRNAPGVQARGNLAMFDWDAAGALATLDIPLLVLGGSADVITKAEASERIAREGSGSVEIIDGVNHMGFLERAELYNLAIRSFAERLQGPQTDPFPSSFDLSRS